MTVRSRCGLAFVLAVATAACQGKSGSAGDGGESTGGQGAPGEGGSASGGSPETGGMTGGMTGGATGTGGTGTGGGAGRSGTGGAGGSAGRGGTGGAAGRGGSGGSGTGGAGTGGSGAAGSAGSCIGSAALSKLGKNRLLVGVSTSDAAAAMAPFDIRYLYISGGLFDSPTPCTACGSSCTAAGKVCTNGCAWWGCYNTPPGMYAGYFMQAAAKPSPAQVPMFTYYEILQTAQGTFTNFAEGAAEVTQAAPSTALMTRYYADWRFLLQQIGQNKALLHIEPDFWGYARQAGSPTSLAAAVASANPTDCGALPEHHRRHGSVSDLDGAQVRAERARGAVVVGLERRQQHEQERRRHDRRQGRRHFSGGLRAEQRRLRRRRDQRSRRRLLPDREGDQQLVGCDRHDVAELRAGSRLGQGADRGAGDAGALLADAPSATRARTTRPTTTRTTASTTSSAAARPASQSAAPTTVPAHWSALAAAHVIGVAFGAGAGEQTTPETDGGYLVSKTKAYVSAGGQPLCQ